MITETCIDEAASLYESVVSKSKATTHGYASNKNIVKRPDFAQRGAGGSVVSRLTSPTYNPKNIPMRRFAHALALPIPPHRDPVLQKRKQQINGFILRSRTPKTEQSRSTATENSTELPIERVIPRFLKRVKPSSVLAFDIYRQVVIECYPRESTMQHFTTMPSQLMRSKIRS